MIRDEFRFRAGGPYILKGPDDVKDYIVDWTDWLADSGPDTISTSTWDVPVGMTLSTSTVTGGKAIAFLSGGVVGTIYHLVNRIITAGGRTAEQGFDIVIEEP